MAEMGSRDLKSNPLVVGTASEAGIVTGSIVGTVISAPANPISAGPIMPEGFITYTDFKPTSDISS
jgi:hypothetical protein